MTLFDSLSLTHPDKSHSEPAVRASLLPNKRNVGFTGAASCSREAFLAVAVPVLQNLILEDVLGDEGRFYVTGGCVGVDEYVATVLTGADSPVHTVLPSNRSRVDRDFQHHCWTYEECPGDYRARNERLVALVGHLIAFPLYPELDNRSRRSGTWMTVRIARTRHVTVDVHLVGGP